MSLGQRKLVLRRQPVVVDIGCCCRRSKPSSLFTFSHATPKPPHHSSPSHCDTSLTRTSTTTTTASSSPSHCSLTAERPKRKQKKGTVEDSEAVVKRSEDPFLDFRDSMVQMIAEKEIYEWDELRRLLHRFLALNSPRHHQLILQAFADICGNLFMPPATTLS